MLFIFATRFLPFFQADPFARISNIHYVCTVLYIGLTDLSWSAGGSVIIVSSTVGFCSLVTFKEGEEFQEKEGEVTSEQDHESAAVAPDLTQRNGRHHGRGQRD